MTNHNPQAFLQKLISRDFETHRYSKGAGHPDRPPLVVTLSRDYGAQGEDIARRLSECLDIPVYDQEILDKVAKRAKTDKFYFKAHDEQAAAGISSFLYSLVSGATVTMQDYRRALYDAVLDLARRDCILVGRGAHLILADKPVFRARAVGSKAACARRVSEEFGISLAEAEKKVHQVNQQRHQSVLNLYGEHIEHCSLEFAKNFDLVINTDHLAVDSAVAIILLAMREMGFDLTVPGKKP
jgi:hypothetical protein